MSTQAALDFPSAVEIAKIVEISDPVIRNLWITWSYFNSIKPWELRSAIAI